MANHTNRRATRIGSPRLMRLIKGHDPDPLYDAWDRMRNACIKLHEVIRRGEMRDWDSAGEEMQRTMEQYRAACIREASKDPGPEYDG